MNTDDGQKKGMFGVVRGGKCDLRGRRRGPRGRTYAEMELDRRMQTAFALLTGPDGNVPGKRAYRIREGDGFPWRVLGRAFVDFWQRRVRREQVKAIVQTLDQWTDDLYDDALTSGEFPRAA